MTQLFANNAFSTLASAIGVGDTALTVQANAGAKFPSPGNGDYFLLTLFQLVGGVEANHEIVKVTARSVDTLTIVRGQEGTAARAWGVGDQVSHRGTAGTLGALAQLGAAGQAFAQPVGVPTATPGNNTNQAASTAFVQTTVSTAIGNLVANSPAALDTLNELSVALGNDPNFAATTSVALGNRLRVDVSTQGLSAQQKVNAATNLGLAAVATSGAKADVGLGAVDNTSDVNKPISTQTQAALNTLTTAVNGKQPLPLAVVNSSFGKRITVFGSSVPYGYGATNNNGWSQRLAAALAPNGYTTTNVCIPGDNTRTALTRFFSDVVPTNPDIVILAYSLGNDGIHDVGPTVAQKEGIYNSYIANIYKLVAMCRQLGYQVVLAGVYGRGDFNALEYQYVRQANQELDNSGIPVLGIGSAADDYTGHWRTGMQFDVNHPNDVGHEAMFRACPLSLFDRLPYGEASMMPTPNGLYAAVIGTDTSAVPLTYTPENAFGNVTVMTNVRRPSTGASGRAVVAYASSNMANGNCLRIRNSADFWDMTFDGSTGNDIISTRLSSDNTRVNLAIRSDYSTNVHTFFIDGVKIGSITVDVGTITGIMFGGRSDALGSNAGGYEFDSMAVWRVGLTDEQIAEAASGRLTKASLVLYSPGVDEFVQQSTHLINLAPSSTYLSVGTSDITTVVRQPYVQRYLEVTTPDAGVRTPMARFAHVGYKSISFIGQQGGGDLGANPGVLLDMGGGAFGIGSSGAIPRMLFDTNGNVNVGGAQPANAYKLWVNGFGSFGNTGSGYDVVDLISPYQANTAVQMRLAAAGNGGSGSMGTTSNHTMYFFTNGVERMRLDTSGNTLLGTAAVTSYNANRRYLAIRGLAGAAVLEMQSGSTTVVGAGTNCGAIQVTDNNMSGEKVVAFIGMGASGSTTANLGGFVSIQTKADNGALTERARFDEQGNLLVGVSSGSSHTILKAGGRNTLVLSMPSVANFYTGDSSSYSAAQACATFYANTTNSRSVSAAGTINAAGADYAEYMTKADTCGALVKGQIVGVDASGKLTDKWTDAVSFLIKSTDPSYVGGDTWGSEEALGMARPVDEDAQDYAEQLAAFNAALEAARQHVDRIAYCGQVPVNVTGAKPGDYVVPVQVGDGIGGQLIGKANITLAQYMSAVGIVQNVLPDGRANVRVKPV